MAVIYKIINNINDKVYIGATRRTLEKRWKEHQLNSNLNRYSKFPLYVAMKEYGTENFFLEPIEECEDSLMNEREVYWIKEYNSYNNGYNATFGGAGKKYIDCAFVFDMWQQGKTLTEISHATGYDRGHLGVILRNMGVDLHEIEDRKKNSCNMPVVMIGRDGQIIKEFKSAREAGRYFGTDRIGSHISDVCNNKRKTCRGYFWKYKDTNYKTC